MKNKSYTTIGILFHLIRVVNRKSRNKFSTLRWRLEGVTLGNNSTIERNVIINAPKKVIIGDNSHIRFGTVITTEILGEGYLTVESNSNINRNCRLDITGGIKIESNVTISNDTIINTHSHGDHPKNKPISSSIEIGERTWIGSNCNILSSVTKIEENCLIGTGAILTKNTEKNGVYIGFPAKYLRKRG